MKKLILTMALLASAQSFAIEAGVASVFTVVGSMATLSCQLDHRCLREVKEVQQEIAIAESTGTISPSLASLVVETKAKNPLLENASDKAVISVLKVVISDF